MRIPTAAAILSALLFCGTLPLYAHHAFDSEFDVNKPLRLEGKVTKIAWGNPHVFVELDVANNAGGFVNWRVELTSVNDVTRSGLNRSSIPVGSVLAVEGFAAKSGERIVGNSTLTIRATGQSVMTPRESWHHSSAEVYDRSTRVQLTGTFVSMDWVNPHATLRFAVLLPNGQRQEWLVETPPINTLSRSGWKRADLSAGDVIQVSGATAKDGSLELLAQSVTLVATNGGTLNPPRPLL